jgi:hypothetical protein
MVSTTYGSVAVAHTTLPEEEMQRTKCLVFKIIAGN